MRSAGLRQTNNNNKSHFLSIIKVLAKYDTVLDKLLQLPKGSPKYLSPRIQNELKSVPAEEVLSDTKSEPQSDPFLPLFIPFLIRCVGAAVISGKYSGLHKKIQDVASHAHYVDCASHNLNLVLKDFMEIVIEIHQYYDTIKSVYSFFGHSILRWQKLQNVDNRFCSNPTLKALN